LVDWAAKLAPHIAAQSVEALAQACAPELDGIRREVISWVGETELARIGKATLGNLRAQARSRIERAGYTATQVGATVAMQAIGVAARLEDRMEGDGGQLVR
jgi:hypothetical protein